MPESEFDKQVQRELEGLRIRPSTAVWENVEKELRRKKRRRVIVVFWLIAGIALLGSSTYFLTSKGDKTLADTTPTAVTPVTGSSAPATQATDVHIPVQHAGENASSDPAATTDLRKNTATDHQETASKQNLPGTGKTDASVTTANKNNTTATDKPGQPVLTQKSRTERPASAKENLNGSRRINRSSDPVVIEAAITKGKTKKPVKTRQEDIAPVREKPVEQVTANAIQDIAATGKESQGNIAEITPAADSVQLKTDSAVAKIKEDDFAVPVDVPVKKAGSKKIKWSVDLAAGGSGPVSRPFLVGNNHADLAYDNVSYMPTQGGGLWQPVSPPANAFGPVYSPRSDIRPGLAYRVGVLAEFPLSDRVSFSTGLQYQYLSNNIRIGSYVNTQLIFNNFASQTVRANGVYQGTQMKTFTNRYHYVQVPLLLNWQMNKSKKLPVILNTGFSAGYLVATNALTYDTLQGGTYYHDKNAFKRFQFSFTTGVSFRFGNNRALQWSIGPEASMGLRKTVKTEYDTRQYPVYIGVQGRIYLPKKK
jgi:hypothetical protein